MACMSRKAYCHPVWILCIKQNLRFGLVRQFRVDEFSLLNFQRFDIKTPCQPKCARRSLMKVWKSSIGTPTPGSPEPWNPGTLCTLRTPSLYMVEIANYMTHIQWIWLGLLVSISVSNALWLLPSNIVYILLCSTIRSRVICYIFWYWDP